MRNCLREMRKARLENPSNTAARKAISREEILRHCRLRTRGTDETTRALEALLLSLTSAMDTLGIPLLKEEMKSIWEEQKHHVPCLQDPPGIDLYIMTGHLSKGGVRLPLFRCARGSTSLESFHLHLARFIPGSSAGAVNYQAFLIDGLTRWNQSRAAAAIDTREELRTFDSELAIKVNALSMTVLGTLVLAKMTPPRKYTGELFGVEYLYSQHDMAPLCPKEEELDKLIDEGFEEVEEDSLYQHVATDSPPDGAINSVAIPNDTESNSDDMEEEVKRNIST